MPVQKCELFDLARRIKSAQTNNATQAPYMVYDVAKPDRDTNGQDNRCLFCSNQAGYKINLRFKGCFAKRFEFKSGTYLIAVRSNVTINEYVYFPYTGACMFILK